MYNLFLVNKFYYQLALSRQLKFIQAKNILQCFVEWIDIPINKFHHFCAEKEGLSYAENVGHQQWIISSLNCFETRFLEGVKLVADLLWISGQGLDWNGQTV